MAPEITNIQGNNNELVQQTNHSPVNNRSDQINCIILDKTSELNQNEINTDSNSSAANPNDNLLHGKINTTEICGDSNKRNPVLLVEENKVVESEYLESKECFSNLNCERHKTSQAQLKSSGKCEATYSVKINCHLNEGCLYFRKCLESNNEDFSLKSGKCSSVFNELISNLTVNTLDSNEKKCELQLNNKSLSQGSIVYSKEIKKTHQDIDKDDAKNYESGIVWCKIDLNSKLEQIKYLNIANLELETIDYDFSPLVNVTSIDLSSNKLTSLPKSFSALKKCTRLIISKNKFIQVPSVLYTDFYFINDLDISFNFICEFDMAPLCLSLLVNLNASHNTLTSPPLWLLHDVPSSLKCLNISFNPCLINKLNPAFFETFETNRISTRIEDLDISNTGFNRTNIKLLQQFTCLKILRMNSKECILNSVFNSIDELPPYLFSQMPLEVLDVENCYLTGLPLNIDKMCHLKVLLVSKNIFSWLPDNISYLECLSVLQASECQLVYLPEEMGLLTSLTELWLSFNDISSLPVLRNCKKLKVLDLYNNSFSELPDTLDHLKLDAFDIGGNYFCPSTFKQATDDALYETLKTCLRSKHDSYTSRSDFIKIEHCSKYPFGNYSSLSRSWGSQRSSRSKKSTLSSSFDRHHSCSQEESWDVDPDDAWDPNLYNNMRTWISEESLSRCRFFASYTHRENYFCPFQEQSNFYQNLYVDYTGDEEQGQFEDA